MSGSSLSWLFAVVGPLVCPAPRAPAPGGTVAGGEVSRAERAALGAPAVPGRRARTQAASLGELYESGITFREFVARADRRRELWEANYEASTPSTDAVERARRIPGRWRLLAIAEDWCSDSVQTIPYLVRLAERVDGIELRIVDSRAGREAMEERRTPDGRAATPTLLVLDEAFEELGCWIERPSALQAWALENRPRLSEREFLERKMAWYAEDAGRSTVDEVLAVIEAAAAGGRVCGGTG